MSVGEAKVFAVLGSERLRLVRLDSAKLNLLPPADKARWFRLASVNLNNSTPDYRCLSKQLSGEFMRRLLF